MNRLLDRLLGLRGISLDDPAVHVEFARHWPAWVWAFLLLACICGAAWSYWRLVGGRGTRLGLAAARTLLLWLVLCMMAGPQVVKQSERVEKDWVVVMVDRSQSMRIPDAPPRVGSATREEQLRTVLAGAWGTLAALQRDRNVLLLGFDSGAFDLKPLPGAPAGSPLADIGEPHGRRTALARSLEQALRRVASKPVAGVLLLSDGRSSDEVPRALLRQMEARQIPLFAVPLGSPTPVPDWAVARVEAPGAVYLGDLVPVMAEVELRGAASAGSARVELLDAQTGGVLDTKTVAVQPGERHRVLLTAKAAREGRANWSVRVTPEGLDLSRDNDSVPLVMDVADRPIRVLYVDGYPRWEYRYLKNLLVREKSIRSSAMLLSGDKRYIQEGSEPLTSIPRSPAEWAAFDVIVMGDLHPGVFTQEQLSAIRDQVAKRGTGVLWIGGSGATPGAWIGSPLGDLLPFAARGGDGADSGLPAWTRPVLLGAGPAAERYAVLRLGDAPGDPWPQALADPDAGWSSLRFAQRIDPAWLKPTAEVLAVARPIGSGGSEDPGAPLVLTMRYGAGRVVYVGTDEIWRLRYGRGEAMPERFYIPLLRLLARDSLGRSGQRVLLEVSPSPALVDQQVQITLRLVDEALAAGSPRGAMVRVVPEGVPSAQGVTVDLRAEGGQGSVATTFTSAYAPSEPGVYRVEPADAALAGLGLGARLEVILPQDELREPQTDHPLLADLAKHAGGRVLAPEELVQLGTLLPNRQIRVVGAAHVETLWDKPVVWAALILLLGAEWIGRRVIRLS